MCCSLQAAGGPTPGAAPKPPPGIAAGAKNERGWVAGYASLLSTQAGLVAHGWKPLEAVVRVGVKKDHSPAVVRVSVAARGAAAGAGGSSKSKGKGKGKRGEGATVEYKLRMSSEAEATSFLAAYAAARSRGTKVRRARRRDVPFWGSALVCRAPPLWKAPD